MIRSFTHRTLSLPIFLSIALPISPAATQETLPQAPNIRAVIQSKSKIEIRSDLNVTVVVADYRKGMAFKKGDLLIEFNCSRVKAERSAANASANAASIELRQKRTLLKHGAAGKGEVELANAAVAKSIAERDVIDQRLNDCSIFAPFDGRVVATTVSPLEMPKQGEPLLVILDDANLEIELVMPSQWLSKVKPNSHFSFLVDETGETLKGTVERFGAEVDPVSQTIEVIGKLFASSQSIRAGMSGSVIFDDIEKSGT